MSHISLPQATCREILAYFPPSPQAVISTNQNLMFFLDLVREAMQAHLYTEHRAEVNHEWFTQGEETYTLIDTLVFNGRDREREDARGRIYVQPNRRTIAIAWAV